MQPTLNNRGGLIVRISETANKNHEELFPNHKSTLKVTDPELIKVFDNFAFDEVITEANLDTRTRLMVILASIIANQALSEYKVMIVGALNVGVTPIEVKEIVYQSVPYVGIAKAFEFIHATNEILQSRGIKLPLEGQSTTTPETRFEKGLELQKTIVGAELSIKCIRNLLRIRSISKNIYLPIVSGIM
jgi:4-carboxymuconolactone decarboxylase